MVATAFLDDGNGLPDLPPRFEVPQKYDGVGKKDRIGLNFTEVGTSKRASVTLYDRGHSATSKMKPGDVYVLNDPYNGGTHLPDVTVITPVFDAAGGEILFYVGSRGHHADIGGVAPGSMPP